MQADHAFVIGRSHKVCEDYARSGQVFNPEGDANRAYALVSDGCSGSEDTDIGSRLVASAAEMFVRNHGTPVGELDCHQVIGDASYVAKAMGADETVLDATLLGVHVSVGFPAGRWISVFGSGDGVIACKLKDGRIVFFDINAPSGYPLYLSYLLNDARRKAVTAACAEWTVDETMEIGLPSRCFSSECVGLYIKRFHGSDSIEGLGYGGEVEVVAAFSDGVKSFTDKDRQIGQWVESVSFFNKGNAIFLCSS